MDQVLYGLPLDASYHDSEKDAPRMMQIAKFLSFVRSILASNTALHSKGLDHDLPIVRELPVD